MIRRPTQLCALLLALLTLGSLLPAQATTYNYDGNGRLRSVTTSSGVATYDYDTRGNLIRIGSQTSTQIVIDSFEPNNGMPGDQITIWGQGFAALKANDAVKFNGLPASIISSSTTQLVVRIPQNAPAGSGPITVTNTNSGNTATSRDLFTVTSVDDPPLIASFVDTTTNTTAGTACSPLAPTCDTVTINGQNLNPVYGETAVQIDGIYVMPTSISNTQIQFTLPWYAGSGPITVTTPYGTATTTTNFFVLPSGYTPSIVTTYTTPLAMGGASQSVSLTTTSNSPTGNSALLFQGSFGDYVSLQTSSFSNSTATVYFSVYSPTDTLIMGTSIFSGMISASNPSIHLPRLNSTGTYMVFLYQASSAMTFSIAVEKNAAITTNGPSTVIPTTVAGQGKRLTFTANAGDNLGLGITGVSVAGGGFIYMRVYLPNNGGTFVNQLGAQAQTCSPPKCSFGLFSLPTMGTYTVTITPSTPTTTFGLTATLSSAVVETLPANPVMNLSASGQVGIYTFTGNANQQVALQFLSSGSGVAIQVYNPDGSNLISTSYVTSANAFNKTLTQAGTYKVLVWLNDISMPGSVTANLAVTAPPGQVTAGGSPLTVGNVQGGQTESFTFTANAGDSLGLGINNQNITGNGSVQITVDRPNGGVLLDQTGNPQRWTCGNPCNFALLKLPDTGQYTVLLEPTYPTTVFSLTATLSNAVSVALPATNTPTTLDLSHYFGQEGIYTLTGNGGQLVAGQHVTLQLSPTFAVGIRLEAPDGTAVLNNQTISTTTTFNNLTLPQNATPSTPYKLYVWPQNNGPGTVSATLQ